MKNKYQLGIHKKQLMSEHIKEPEKCPKYGFEGLMESVGKLGTTKRKYICPNCKYQFEK